MFSINRYAYTFLFLQYTVTTVLSDEILRNGSVILKNGTILPSNVTELTWREILPDFCGYKGSVLKEKIKQLQRNTRDVEELGGNKVANGKFTYIAAHPWQIALVTSDEKIFKCGGSIISKYHVLTATHCFLVMTKQWVKDVAYDKAEVVPFSKRLVVVGFTRYAESNLIYKIKELYIHNYYSFRHHRNDIALLKIDGEFVWTKSVFPICLPLEDEPYTPGRDCTISGFGDLSSYQSNGLGLLQYGRVSISPDDYCKKHNEQRFKHIGEGMFCANGYLGEGLFVDTCKGDSGGPLYCEKSTVENQHVLLGITSFGHQCGLKNYPGVYTKVSKYLKWIRDRVEVSLGYGYGHRSYLPEDEDVGRPVFVSDV